MPAKREEKYSLIPPKIGGAWRTPGPQAVFSLLLERPLIWPSKYFNIAISVHNDLITIFISSVGYSQIVVPQEGAGGVDSNFFQSHNQESVIHGSDQFLPSDGLSFDVLKERKSSNTKTNFLVLWVAC